VPGSERTTYEGQAAVELELAADGPANRIAERQEVIFTCFGDMMRVPGSRGN
jgi:hydrogenase maturation factor